jgi:hypothetical protein
MARPQRNNVDYFPHECSHGRKMFVIESKYGNDGYAVWFKLLEKLGDAENHFLDLRDETQFMYLASLMKVSEEKFRSILFDLAKMGAIHTLIYEQHSIVWSQKLIDSIEDAYDRRNNKCITFEGLCSHLQVTVVHKQAKLPSNTDSNTQNREEDIKVKKRRGSAGDFEPPILSDVISYFSEKGYTEKSARKAFSFYSESNWIDSKGNPVKNWKQKMIGVWFKDENKDLSKKQSPEESGKIKFRWEKEPNHIIREIEKERAELYFKNQFEGGLIPVYL